MSRASKALNRGPSWSSAPSARSPRPKRTSAASFTRGDSASFDTYREQSLDDGVPHVEFHDASLSRTPAFALEQKPLQLCAVIELGPHETHRGVAKSGGCPNLLNLCFEMASKNLE